ncbi:MAG: DNA circularization N-terminal domain-containing protein [Sideroxydans sp.]
MAWADTLLEASFRGVIFDIVKTDDSADRALAEHTYPYVDGADVEDMGRGARRIGVEAVFYGDDYEVRLQGFLAALEQSGSGEFVHPVFGSIKNAQPSRVSVHHDAENPDYASVTIEFIESTPGKSFFGDVRISQKTEAITQQGSIAIASASENVGKLIDRLRAANPMAGLDTLRASLTAPLLAITSSAGVLLSGLDVLAYPRAWGNDISSLVGGILDVREWGARLDADWASIQSDLNAFSIFSAAPSVAQPLVAADNEPTEAQAIAAAAVTIQVNVAVGMANAASYLLSSEAATPTMSPSQIELVCNKARTAIDTAIAQVRTVYGIEQSRAITEPLKGQALAVQEAAQAIIALRPPLILRMVETPGTMRLIAHLWYGDHSRASELYRLNGARAPFLNVGDSIYAYAR